MLTASPLTVCVRSGRLSQLSLMQSSSSRSLQFSMPRCHLNIRHLIYIIGTESSSLFVLASFKRTGIGTGIIMFILTIPSPTNGVLLHMNTQFSAITETVLFFFFCAFLIGLKLEGLTRKNVMSCMSVNQDLATSFGHCQSNLIKSRTHSLEFMRS